MPDNFGLLPVLLWATGVARTPVMVSTE